MLLKMPGITTKNIHRIMNHVQNVCELVLCSVEKLIELLENEPFARQLYRFLHAEHIDASALAADTARQSKTAKYLDFKNSKRKRMK